MTHKHKHNKKEINQAMASKGTDQKWQAEIDAQTMASYQEIMGDRARMQRAVKVAKRQAADLSKRASAMQNVAKSGSRRRK